MLINDATLDAAFKGFKTVFTDAQMQVESHYDKVAMTVPSSARDETYGWLGQGASLREWVGPRVVHSLEAHSFTILNRTFEKTVRIKRNDFSDDRLGVFKPFFASMGQEAKRHPDELVFGLLKSGFATGCYDGQYFFDSDHPVKNAAGDTVNVSNTQSGSGAAWFLLDTSQAVKPMIWQTREDYEFQRMDRPSDPHVFLNDEFIYGIRARVNAGFGLWQLAYGSKATLDATNYASARAAMMAFKGDGGRILGVKPTLLVVPPALEEAALNLLNTDTVNGGGSNPWKGTAQLVVTPYLAD